MPLKSLRVVAGRQPQSPHPCGWLVAKLNLFRAAQPMSDTSHTCSRRPSASGRLDRLAGEPNVVANHHFARLSPTSAYARPIRRANILVELVGNTPAHGSYCCGSSLVFARREPTPTVRVIVFVDEIRRLDKTRHATAIKGAPANFIGHSTQPDAPGSAARQSVAPHHLRGGVSRMDYRKMSGVRM